MAHRYSLLFDSNLLTHRIGLWIPPASTCSLYWVDLAIFRISHIYKQLLANEVKVYSSMSCRHHYRGIIVNYNDRFYLQKYVDNPFQYTQPLVLLDEQPSHIYESQGKTKGQIQVKISAFWTQLNAWFEGYEL